MSIHGGTVFSLLALLTTALVLGRLVELLHLPPLLGMLLAGGPHVSKLGWSNCNCSLGLMEGYTLQVSGVVLKNVPYIDVARGVDPEWYSATRCGAGRVEGWGLVWGLGIPTWDGQKGVGMGG